VVEMSKFIQSIFLPYQTRKTPKTTIAIVLKIAKRMPSSKPSVYSHINLGKLNQNSASFLPQVRQGWSSGRDSFYPATDWVPHHRHVLELSASCLPRHETAFLKQPFYALITHRSKDLEPSVASHDALSCYNAGL
jgi:hypothetical protein